MTDVGRGKPNVESELDPMPEADEERIEVEQLVPDGMEDESNVAEYRDDDDGARESLDDFEKDDQVA